MQLPPTPRWGISLRVRPRVKKLYPFKKEGICSPQIQDLLKVTTITRRLDLLQYSMDLGTRNG